MSEANYHNQVNIKNTELLRERLSELPSFCMEYFRGIGHTTSSRTRIAYAYDLKVFFEFLTKTNPELKNTLIKDIKIDILDKIKAVDIEEYLEYLNYYVSDGIERTNSANGKKRKLASLRSFYNYFFKKGVIDSNPAIGFASHDIFRAFPKLNDKEIVRLDIDEVAKLLDEVESGESMTKKQKQYHSKNRLRDLAIMTLLLGTGLRVSECVGVNLNDLDFDNNGVKIRRKGGNEVVIYFGDEVEEALQDYIKERKGIIPLKGHENALFLSIQKRRISVRAVENLVKKYSSSVTKLKNITPHKLRSTYGTSLYRETGDIYLVADVLGHSDVNTTKNTIQQLKIVAAEVQLM